MCGYSDLTAYESEEERNAVCAELARMLRIVPLALSPAPETVPPCHGRTPAASGAGDSFSTQGASA